MTNSDNYTRIEDKARWGFQGSSNGTIQVASQTVGETPEQGIPDSLGVTGEDKAARQNGGGVTQNDPLTAVTSEDGTPEKKTIAELKGLLDEAHVTYPASASKAELVALYKTHLAA